MYLDQLKKLLKKDIKKITPIKKFVHKYFLKNALFSCRYNQPVLR